MKRSLLAMFLVAVALAGCATLDNDDRVVLRRHAVSPALLDRMTYGETLAVSDVIELSRKGLPGLFIIRYMRLNESVYRLSVNDVARLRSAGVDPNVINFMLGTSVYSPQWYPYPTPYPYYPYYF